MNAVFRIIEGLAVALYLALGAYLLLNSGGDVLPKPYSAIFGIVLVLYGVFRLYKLILKLRRAIETDNEEA